MDDPRELGDLTGGTLVEYLHGEGFKGVEIPTPNKRGATFNPFHPTH